MKRNTHKILLTLLSGLLLAVLLAACGNSAENKPLPSQNAATIEPSLYPSASAPGEEHMEHESDMPTATPEATTEAKPTAAPTTKPQASAKPSPKPSPSPSPSASHDDHHSGRPDDDDSKATPSASSEDSPKSTPAATASASEGGGKEYVVEITNFAFSPAKLEIKAGDRVKFINKDEIKHSATADDSSFDTGLLAQDENKTVTFDDAGEFAYHCMPHPGMQATITVSDK
ncbi:cupredoxin family copper-binding protein [Paenibacillus glycanilyticus]|uniref:cupredoxin domain-containing protein n=1 Tax=Paenibacillus glycanilyticus TaxID=126569 RepID=UPI00203DA295|nr:cupredoxin family copper-binding protein [Paenibacillus glycanilyticus]MCM3626386.1 cupredoxin family copper-binding protein [Paenibacillus glycanilyticus]